MYQPLNGSPFHTPFLCDCITSFFDVTDIVPEHLTNV